MVVTIQDFRRLLYRIRLSHILFRKFKNKQVHLRKSNPKKSRYFFGYFFFNFTIKKSRFFSGFFSGQKVSFFYVVKMEKNIQKKYPEKNRARLSKKISRFFFRIFLDGRSFRLILRNGTFQIIVTKKKL